MPFSLKRGIALTSLCLGLLGAGAATAQSGADAASPSERVPGLISTPVDGSVHEIAGRFADAARTSGMTVFARIDHRQAAISRDLALLPNEVILFGNARGGTPLIQCASTAGIDLPMKALVWQDAQGQTWLGYNDPAWIAERHGTSDCGGVAPLQESLAALVSQVSAP